MCLRLPAACNRHSRAGNGANSRTVRGDSILFLLLSVALFHGSSALSVPPSSACARRSSMNRNRCCVAGTGLSLAMPSLLLSDYGDFVEVFDGSTITNPVVVSHAFWGGLQSKLLFALAAQLGAGLAFVVLTLVFAAQFEQLSESLGKFSTTARPRSDRTPDVRKLAACLALDFLGTSSAFVPGIGELTDLAFAPVAAVVLRSLYGGSNVVFALELAEELLPFTDVLPLATLCWSVETLFPDSSLARLLRIGDYGGISTTDDDDDDGGPKILP